MYYTETCSNPVSPPNSGTVAEKLKTTPINQLSQCNIVKSLFVLLRKSLWRNSLDTYTLNIQMHTKETQKAHIQPRGSFRTTHHFVPERKSCKPQLHYSLSKTRTTSVGPTVCQPDSKPGLTSQSKWEPEDRRLLGIVQDQDTDAKESYSYSLKKQWNNKCLPSFPPPWEVSDLVARGGILGKDQVTTRLKTAVPSASTSRLPTGFISTTPCPPTPQHHQPHFIWKAIEIYFTGHSFRFLALIKNHN